MHRKWKVCTQEMEFLPSDNENSAHKSGNSVLKKCIFGTQKMLTFALKTCNSSVNRPHSPITVSFTLFHICVFGLRNGSFKNKMLKTSMHLKAVRGLVALVLYLLILKKIF